jgi:hypothetical protein
LIATHPRDGWDEETGSIKMDSPADETRSELAAERRARARRRHFYLLYAIFVAFLALNWMPDVKFHGLEMRYWGWGILAFAALGMMGVNVFWGSPEDKRLDRQP